MLINQTQSEASSLTGLVSVPSKSCTHTSVPWKLRAFSSRGRPSACPLSWRRQSCCGGRCVSRCPLEVWTMLQEFCQSHGLANMMVYLSGEMWFLLVEQWFWPYACLLITQRNYGGIVLFFFAGAVVLWQQQKTEMLLLQTRAAKVNCLNLT